MNAKTTIQDSLEFPERFAFGTLAIPDSTQLPDSTGSTKCEPPVTRPPGNVGQCSPNQESLISCTPDDCRFGAFGFVVLGIIGIRDGIKSFGLVLYGSFLGCLRYFKAKVSEDALDIICLRSPYPAARGRSASLLRIRSVQFRHAWLWRSRAMSTDTSGFGWSSGARSRGAEGYYVVTTGTYHVSALCLARFYFSIHPCRHACFRCLGHMRIRGRADEKPRRVIAWVVQHHGRTRGNYSP
jgi:hypothetical protein